MKRSTPTVFHEPSFPPLKWSDADDRWEGEIDLDIGGTAGLLVMPEDPSSPEPPTEAQKKALAFQLESGKQVTAALLTALRRHYNKWRPRFKDFLAEEYERLMPAIKADAELLPLIELYTVYVHPAESDGMAYVGLGFRCTWDIEHGLGAILHRDTVVELEGADIAFNWYAE